MRLAEVNKIEYLSFKETDQVTYYGFFPYLSCFTLQMNNSEGGKGNLYSQIWMLKSTFAVPTVLDLHQT